MLGGRDAAGKTVREAIPELEGQGYFDLVALARRLATEYQQSTERHGIEVISAVPSLTGEWDPPRLERVVGNLLSNAVKFSSDGGTITLTLDHEQDRPGDWAVLSVQDHGVGIPAEALGHVFDRFFRASNVSGQIAGSGIGLVGVQQIVRQHGGSVAVTSDEGRGTTFTIRLPLRPPTNAE